MTPQELSARLTQGMLEAHDKGEISTRKLIEFFGLSYEEELKMVRNRIKHREEILGAIARGYCTPENETKTVDPTLCEAMCDEVLKLLDAKIVEKAIDQANNI